MANRVTFDGHRYRVGDIVQVSWYPSGQIVEAEVKAIKATTTGTKLQVTSGQLTALITLDQIVER